MVLDPDVPDRQNRAMGEICHWLVTNIPGNDVTKGECKVEYVGSGPMEGSGLHRYTFLVYKQKAVGAFGDFQKIFRTTIDGRKCWKVRTMADEHGLELVAGNFYLAEHDDYVIEIHRQFGLVK